MISERNDSQQQTKSPEKKRKRRRTIEERIAALETEIEAKRVDLGELKKKKAAEEKAVNEKAAQKIVSELVQIEGVDKLSAEDIGQALQDALKKKRLF